MAAQIQVYHRAMNTMKNDRKKIVLFFIISKLSDTILNEPKVVLKLCFHSPKCFLSNQNTLKEKKNYKTFCLLRKCKIIYTIPSFLVAAVTWFPESLKRYELLCIHKVSNIWNQNKIPSASFINSPSTTNLRGTGFFLHQVFPVSNGFKLQV